MTAIQLSVDIVFAASPGCTETCWRMPSIHRRAVMLLSQTKEQIKSMKAQKAKAAAEAAAAAREEAAREEKHQVSDNKGAASFIRAKQLLPASSHALTAASCAQFLKPSARSQWLQAYSKHTLMSKLRTTKTGVRYQLATALCRLLWLPPQPPLLRGRGRGKRRLVPVRLPAPQCPHQPQGTIHTCSSSSGGIIHFRHQLAVVMKPGGCMLGALHVLVGCRKQT